MNIDRSAIKISLTEDETRLALAYLGEGETSKLLAQQIADKAMERMVMRVGVSNYIDSDPDELLRRETPDLFSYELSYDHRAPLLGAFVLGAESQEPVRKDVLIGMEPDQIVGAAAAARDALLALS